MLTIHHVLRKVNPYAAHYRRLGEAAREEEERVRHEGGRMGDIRLLLAHFHSDDLWRYNSPAGPNQGAFLFVSEDGNVPRNIDIAVHPKHHRTRMRIDRNSRDIDPMIFVLLFPSGDPGWTVGIPHDQNATARNNTVTPQKFHAH